MLNKLFPWKYLLKIAAKRYDIIDPLSVAARIRSFAQPSEVQEPIELLRAGIIFHARGLLNTKAIQHNLDWVWPYWVERQFNPRDRSFIPRAFSFSHINLTHRNWTALGLPDIPVYPLVDPHGLITPLQDGWSIDCWFLDDDGRLICPSRSMNVEQKLIDDSERRIVTRCDSEKAQFSTEAVATFNDGKMVLKVTGSADSAADGWLIYTLRPYNPEGVQFIEKAESLPDNGGWIVNGETSINFSSAADKMLFSDYRSGDVSLRLNEPASKTGCECSIGLVTAASFHRIQANNSSTKEYGYSIELPFSEDFPDNNSSRSWPEAEEKAARLQIPDKDIQFLYDTALRTLIHLTAGDTVPGPYTYNRFWFRDACIMLNALLTIGLDSRCRKHLETFARRQSSKGFFHSQDGEWDSNGQVLWLKNRFRLLSTHSFPEHWLKSIVKGVRWIADKRLLSEEDAKLKGLLPPGFSAEHFGPNDHYYWDDFWSVAGLRGAAETLSGHGRDKDAGAARTLAAEMEQDLLRSIGILAEERNSHAIPTSPNRRLDSAAIGSIVADYPLQMFEPGDQRIMATADFLFNNCLQKGCFFQDMIHSGINIYMTLELAHVYLRAGDIRFRELLKSASALASPTGQWPEAIHPHTDGGCMGDGQHGWAVAEYIMLLRNMFVMEEADALIIGRGILPEWLEMKKPLAFGPTLTPYGRVRVLMEHENDALSVRVTGEWRNKPARVIVKIPGYEQVQLSEPDYRAVLEEIA